MMMLRVGRTTMRSLWSGVNATLLDRQKRILYRCKQRGILELDLLLGTWAAKHIDTLDVKQLDELERLADGESHNVLKWILKTEEPPEKETESSVLRSLQEYAQTDEKPWRPSGKSGNQ